AAVQGPEGGAAAPRERADRHLTGVRSRNVERGREGVPVLFCACYIPPRGARRRIGRDMMRHIAFTAVAFGALMLAACGEQTSGGADAGAAADCSRDCLSGLLDQYLAALDAGDASALPTAEGLRFTE